MTTSPQTMTSLLQCGEEYLARAEFAQALELFTTAQSLAEQTNDLDALLQVLPPLSTIYLDQGAAERAIDLGKRTLCLSIKAQNSSASAICHRQLARLYRAQGKFETALEHLEAALALQPSSTVDQAMLGKPALAALPPRSWPDYQVLQVPMLFRHIVEQAHIGVAIFQEGRIVYCNRCFQRWIGYPGKTPDNGMSYLPSSIAPSSPVSYQPIRLEQILPGTDYQSLLACHWPPTMGNQVPDLCRSERQLNCQNGVIMEVEFYASVIEFNDRPAVLTFMRDITERKQMEHHLKDSEARYRSLFDHVPMGLCRFSPEGKLLDANPALVGIFGFSDRNSFLAANTLQQSTTSQAWQTCLSQGGPLKQCELHLCRQDGRNLWVRVIARAVTEINGQVVYYEGAVEDITEIRAAQAALEELAIRDSLTHIYNRRHFLEVTKREIARASRFNHATSLILIDIDHFKTVNDTYGHLMGDQVLRDVVLRIKENLRESDILARYGGEEFIVLMPETNAIQAWYGAERLRRVVGDRPFAIGQENLAVTISVGVTSWLPCPSLPPLEGLLDQADQALYRAKQNGRNRTETLLVQPPLPLQAKSISSVGLA